jgi:ribose/xylose/arabinose/galactoside ABC-type transport system permease subunit
MTQAQASQPSSAVPQASKPSRTKGLLGNQGLTMLLILILLWIVLSIMSPHFRTVSNLMEITLQAAVVAIIAAGSTLVIISGGIDLSVGSVFACSAVVGGMVYMNTGNLFLSLATTLATGSAFGLTNGLLITRIRVPPFIATLGMMGIARGLALIISGGIPIYGLSDAYQWIGQGEIFGFIPVPTVIVVIVYAVFWVLMNYTRFGRFVYAIGSNAEAARLSGINVAAMLLGIYTIAGLMSGLASIVEAGRLATIQPAGGNGYELLAIGAVLIGGASTFGGEGSILATLVGALLVTTIRNGLNIMGVNAFWQYVVNGVVIIAAVAVDQYRRRRA